MFKPFQLHYIWYLSFVDLHFSWIHKVKQLRPLHTIGLLRKKRNTMRNLSAKSNKKCKSPHKPPHKPDEIANVSQMFNLEASFMAVISNVSILSHRCVNLMKYCSVSSQNAKQHMGTIIAASRTHTNNSIKPSTMNGNIHAGRVYLNGNKKQRQADSWFNITKVKLHLKILFNNFRIAIDLHGECHRAAVWLSAHSTLKIKVNWSIFGMCFGKQQNKRTPDSIPHDAQW